MAEGSINEYFIKYGSGQTFPMGSSTEEEAKDYVLGKRGEDPGATLWKKTKDHGIVQVDLN